MKRELQSFSSLEHKNKKGYWLDKTVEERFQHVEKLRRINYGDKATQPIQRVLRVIKSK